MFNTEIDIFQRPYGLTNAVAMILLPDLEQGIGPAAPPGPPDLEIICQPAAADLAQAIGFGEIFNKKQYSWFKLYSQADVHNSLGVLYHAQGEYEKAVQEFEEGLACIGKMGTARLESFFPTSLGDLLIDCITATYERGDWEYKLAGVSRWPKPRGKLGICRLPFKLARRH